MTPLVITERELELILDVLWWDDMHPLGDDRAEKVKALYDKLLPFSNRKERQEQ